MKLLLLVLENVGRRLSEWAERRRDDRAALHIIDVMRDSWL